MDKTAFSNGGLPPCIQINRPRLPLINANLQSTSVDREITPPQTEGLSASDHQLLTSITTQLKTIAGNQGTQLSTLNNIESRLDTYETAFVLNDLHKPDFEGHRASHRSMIEASKTLEGYKIDLTKKALAWVGGILALFFFTGAGDFLRKAVSAAITT